VRFGESDEYHEEADEMLGADSTGLRGFSSSSLDRDRPMGMSSKGPLKGPLVPQSRRARAAEAQRLRAETLDKATRLGVFIPDEVRLALTSAGASADGFGVGIGSLRAETPTARSHGDGSRGGPGGLDFDAAVHGTAAASAALDATYAREVVLETLHPGDDSE